jgi:membrane-bound lytic murein transglycosylase A
MLVRAIVLGALVSGAVLGGMAQVVSQTPKPVASPRPSPSPSPVMPALPLRPLAQVPDLVNLGIDDRLFTAGGDRSALLSALNQSLRYIQTPAAQKQYASYAVPGFTRSRVEKSLQRFRQLVVNAKSAAELQAAVQKEFQFYASVGKDGQGRVEFTGYYVPVQRGSRTKTATYRYPLYKTPPGFRDWPSVHPTREQLEGTDGLQSEQSKLKGQELVYLADRLSAFLIHVQGSSQIQLTDGTTMSVGFAAATNHAYSSLGKELIKDGKFAASDLTLPKVLAYFQANPADLDIYIPRNRRFVFFQNTQGSPPLGSLGYPVTADRSIATDKRQLPPGALALIHTQLPNQQLVSESISRFVLDQDTGSAIVGAGRVDVFLGTGDVAGQRAGLVNAPGQLYYLLLK